MTEKTEMRAIGLQACEHEWSKVGESFGIQEHCSRCGISKPTELEEYWMLSDFEATSIPCEDEP